MKTFYIQHIACERRGMDAERVKNYLLANRIRRVVSPEEADYIFLFTCSFTSSVGRNMEAIARFNKLGGELIVCGCLPTTHLKEIRNIFKGKILGTKDIDKIDEIFPDFVVRFKNVEDPIAILLPLLYDKENINAIKQKVRKLTLFNLATPWNRVLKYFRHIRPIHTDQNLSSIRISWGCMGNCTYCTIKKSTRKFKSKPLPSILQELEKAISNRQYRINIISADSGSYGLDIGTDLPACLNAILEKDKRITIDILKDLHASAVCRYKDALIKLVKTKRIKMIRIGVQTRSARLLKLMNRNLDFLEFKAVMGKIKRAYPKIGLSAQIIAGFPTETEEEFQSTIKYLKDCGFDDCAVYDYFEYEISDSVEIKPKVPAHIIEERVEKAKRAFKSHYYADINLDRIIGKVGLFLKRHCPKPYYKLKDAMWRIEKALLG